MVGTEENTLNSMLREYVALEKQKRELDEELKKVKARLGELHDPLLKEFEEMGVNSINVNGFTVYIQRQLWAKPSNGDYETATVALRKAGLGDYVQTRFNVQSVSAYVRELDKAGEPLPEELRGAIDISEVYNLRTRKSN